MNDPCPICGKERGTVVGDFPRSYFCEGHKTYTEYNPMLYATTLTNNPKNEERIIELLEEILSQIKIINKFNAKYK